MRLLLFRKYGLAALLGACALLAACERDVPKARLPDVPSKLVAACFISPQDTLLQVHVSQTVPAGMVRDGGRIRDAAVTLSDGSRTVAVPFVEDPPGSPYPGGYRLAADQFPIQAGKTYFLQVSVPDGRTLQARCTVPEPGPPLEVRVASRPSSSRHVFTYRWQPPATAAAYYRLSGEIVRREWDGREKYVAMLFWNSTAALFASAPGSGPLQPSYEYIPFDWTPVPGTPTLVLKAMLLTTDEPYYRYHESLGRFQNAAGNPFAEPVLIYSNMEGGLGVFAAYTQQVVPVEF